LRDETNGRVWPTVRHTATEYVGNPTLSVIAAIVDIQKGPIVAIQKSKGDDDE